MNLKSLAIVAWSKSARSEDLTYLCQLYDIYRKWYEKIPILGDYLYRKRTLKTLKSKGKENVS